MTRTLVTGATGFVGSHVAERLCDGGHALRCTVRATSDRRWLDGLRAETATADLADTAAELDPILEAVEQVVHAAGVTRASREEVFRRVNVEGTARLAEASRRAGVRRFVFVSSLAARGPDGGDGPVSAYGKSKLRAEERLRRVSAEGEMVVVVLRPGGVYGPRDRDLLPLFRLAARGWFPYVPSGGEVQPAYVRDVSGAVVRAVETEDPAFGPWPVAGRGRFAWPDLGEGMEAALGREVRRVPVPGALLLAAGAAAELAARATGGTPGFDRRSARDLARHSWTCDTAAAEEALGWRPSVDLGEGLARSARWYRDAGWL